MLFKNNKATFFEIDSGIFDVFSKSVHICSTSTNGHKKKPLFKGFDYKWCHHGESDSELSITIALFYH